MQCWSCADLRVEVLLPCPVQCPTPSTPFHPWPPVALCRLWLWLWLRQILELCQLTAVRKQVVVHLLFPSSPAAMAAAARPGKTAPRKGASSWASFTGGAPAANHTGTPHLPQAVSFAALPRHNQNLQPGSGSGTSGAGTVDLERRVVMAMEMAGNPSVLFLDQPFVGMDLPQMINFARILKVVAHFPHKHFLCLSQSLVIDAFVLL